MIDWNRVRTLRDDIGPDEFDEVVDLFLEEVEEVVERLRGASGSDSLEYDLHSLKNGALNLGFTELSELCQAGEKCASSGQLDIAGLPKITESYDMSRALFLKELPVQLAN